MKTWLVTGGAGFIGSHLVEALLAQGDRVIVLDDCSTGSLANLSPVAGNRRLEILHGSVCDQLLVDEACTEADAVVHLAAAVGVQRILDKQVRSIVTNLRGTEVVLQAAAGNGMLPVFLASTSEVYGKGASVPFREGDDSVIGATDKHRWSYACSKMMDEYLALAYWRERGLPVRIARFFNTTGPRQSPHYGMVLPRFCAAAQAGEQLVVHGDGNQQRCFLHVDDCISAVLALLDSSAAIGQVVNIGSDEEVSIKELAEMVVSRSGNTEAGLTFIPYEEAFPEGGFEDMRRRVPSTDRLRELTGWTPAHSLADLVDACLADAEDDL
jgi:UDP-glucose 4-epimerase